MHALNTLSQGWLRNEIQSAIEELIVKSYVSQVTKDSFNDIRQSISESTVLKKPTDSEERAEVREVR